MHHVKMSVLLDLTYRFSAIPIKISAKYYADINKPILRFIRRDKRCRIAKTILKEKNRVRGVILFNFKTYCKATVIKAIWYCKENRQIDQWNRIEYLAMEFIFDKGAKAIQ